MYSWGEFYETTSKCDDYSEEEKKKFKVFEALDEAKTFDEIRKIIGGLSEEQINWLNSPCLDGIICSIKDPKNFMNKEYIETWKFFLTKNLIKPNIEQICMKNYTNVIFSLVELNKLERNELNNALRWASRNGHTETVNLLLDRGADIHANNDGALRSASYHGHTETVKLLLDRGADIHADNDSALHWASYNGHTETVKTIINNTNNLFAFL
jgi:hypothetical protein